MLNFCCTLGKKDFLKNINVTFIKKQFQVFVNGKFDIIVCAIYFQLITNFTKTKL